MCLNPGDILCDRYEIIEQLGRGGFAITYTAKDLEQPENSPCVVKEILPPQSKDPRVLQEAKALFEKEAKALEDLDKCQGIPKLIHHCQQKGKFYLIQEYIEGTPLNQELFVGKQFKKQEVIDLLLELLSILDCVHSQGMIHRDIKPSNLIRRKSDNKIFLIDFGAVKAISNLAIDGGQITQTRAVGTDGYMPAEQWKNQPKVNSDIYAAGIMGIQAIAGLDIEDLFHHKKTCEIIWRYATHDRPIVQISDNLEKVLNKMVRYHFIDRYQSAGEVLQDLRSIRGLQLNTIPIIWLLLRQYNCMAGILFIVVPPPPPPPPPPPLPHLRPPKWTVFIAIAVLLGLSTYLIRNRTPETPALIQGDSVSGGEEILVKTSSPRSKEKGVKELAKSNYQSAFKLFKKSWNEDNGKDPETLIYMNNAFLEASKTPYYTIAVVLPVSNRKNPDRSVYMADRGKEFLRGVAQAQTEVNLGLLNSNSDPDFPGQDFLPPSKAIKGKGLKIIIADDENDGEKAKKRAIALVKQPDILAVVGHASSEMTMQAVDIYNNNNLVLMSPGAATEELTYEPKTNFFRSIYTTSLITKDLAKYLLEKNQKQAVIVYNPGSPFGASFREEFTKYFRDSRGGKIVWIRDFDLSKQDFNAKRAIEEIQGKGETAIVLVPDPHLTVSLDRAFEIIKLNGDRNWIVGAWTLVFPQMLELASQQKQNLFKKLIFSVSWHPLSSPNPEFPQQARSLWGEEGNTRISSAYDATRALIKALEMQQQPSREGMQKMLADPKFSADGATGTIQFESPKNGNRKNPPSDLVHIVQCPKEQFGLAFVPVKYPTAVAAGLKCD
ncbi:bifunctional serine/threonine-protein kinase/ABC transporter substrate-binding protein [Microcoleus sp. PH2017_02_FOX_O_A]|uniref:bifunctional serine/threonine-protein kinase/ABC transporter substrate-binding protein n=1 Tax=Microcoleus sp. PH2017_02_FOX_O_A TaxID=2798813 RepID=UPI001D242CA8|nr:bifunctional serine/threonine-protein kinase/ABC transporter substrate-binding protein [Microcoleus sp. PH2017_02_FOX_O_A]MCC3466300.1 ABC transporter substrate-binding protein [Microcoleus sp. PH2017_06_SFM_O_A]TAG03770.1 MAG: serine/threonine protein kinase [Oscillatoriales cyanobacterium]MCC3413237.1 ABC transporter substrate-binding protein [Microcoleus sp. PH2017_02_FOX_O_A]TAG22890.1 MAG: serine/threonine protein kinase [Oscillatoriales cyanobacterium]TAG46560.1 MAG: serine/threonine 